MMRSFCLFFLISLLASGPVWSSDTLQSILDGDGPWPRLTGLQVVTLDGGQTDQCYSLGSARLVPPVPLTPRHKMRVASISKIVTAIAAMQLVEQQHVGLDQDVSLYIGWEIRNPHFPDTAITLRHLLSHTSSIRDGQRYWLDPGNHIRSFFLPGSGAYEGGAHFARGDGRGPGEYFTYSNLNFGLIAGIVETVSGERFDRYVANHILIPLGLSSHFSACRIPHRNLATLYRGTEAQIDGETLRCHYGSPPVPRGEKGPKPLPGYRAGENPTLFSPQGGLRASAEDLAVIMRMLLAGGTLDGVKILNPATVKSMLIPVWRYDAVRRNGETGAEGGTAGLMQAYGLSFHIVNLKQWGLSDRDRYIYGHLGNAYGLLGHFWFDPQTKDGFISLVTGTLSSPGDAPTGSSPLSRVEEELLKWWLARRTH